MYHDEFAPRSVRDRGDFGGAYAGLAIEVGGGVSAAVASGIVLPEMPVLLSIGGLLPMVACCLGILMVRCREALAELLRYVEAVMFGGRESPARPTRGRPMAMLRGPRSDPGRTRAVRAGFDRSRRLG